MAIRIDASSEKYTRTASLPARPVTMMGWFRVENDGNKYHTCFTYGGGAAQNYCQCGALTTGSNSTFFLWAPGLDGETTGGTLTLDTWFHVAHIVRAASSAGKDSSLYINGVDNTSAGGDHVVSSFTTLGFGESPDNDGFFDGQMAAIKIFEADMTADEIKQEMWYYQPAGRHPCFAYYPLFSTADDEIDFSGNGRTLTVGGAPATYNEGPPIAWSPYGRRFVSFAASAPGVTTMDSWFRETSQPRLVATSLVSY